MTPRGFETYQFHSTLGYRLVKLWPSEIRRQEMLARRIERLFRGEASTVTLEPIAYNLLDDMLAFPRVHVL